MLDHEGLVSEMKFAEDELLKWALGHRSNTNLVMDLEGSAEDRAKTLAAIDHYDAATIELHTQRLIALRVLAYNDTSGSALETPSMITEVLR